MITKDEIEQKSKDLAINTSDIQRDYLFGWLLNYIFTKSSLKDTLFLKGGNALRKAYFINTRFSSDLDFGTPEDLDIEQLKTEIVSACDYVNNQSGIQFVVDRNDVQEKFGKWKEDRWKVFEVKIYFKDFYGNSKNITLKISLDITRFDEHYLPIQERSLIHPYSDSSETQCVIRCAQLEEILATKLKCTLQRERAGDVFDLIYSIYLNSDIPVDKALIREVFLHKTIFESNPGVAKNILLKLPFEYLKAVWKKSIVCTQDVLLDVDEAVHKFTSSIEDIFDGVSGTSWDDSYFFGPEFRNAILKAGRDMTLLKVVYLNHERMIEPYALKFQERKDGVAKEYFYVYDRVGSKNNPDWKTFVAENFQSIENTDEKFNPQYEIELCKSGEIPEDRYLYDRDKHLTKEYERAVKKARRGNTSRTKVQRTYSFGPTHVFKCSNCGKLFYKKSYDGNIKEHKSKRGGYPCYGYGIFVKTKY